MLRLLLVALPLVVALPAAFDEQEINALQFEVRDLRPRPALFAHSPREINTIAPPHSTPHAHHPPTAHITMDAPRHKRDDLPHDLLRLQPL